MSNYHFLETEMSLKAKGLLSLMLSLPDNWDFSIKGLTSLSKDGTESVMSAIDELKKFGYLEIVRVKNDNNQFSKVKYNIYEKPCSGNPNTGNPNSEKPNSENHAQLNTNKYITNELNTKESNTSKKERTYSTYDDILGEFDISDKDLIDAIYDFIKMRKMIKKPMTDRALRMVINKIRDFAPNDIKTQIKILEQSIMNSWQGVFPLQTEQTRRHFNGDVIMQKGRKYEFKNGDWFLVGGNNIPVDPFRDDDDDFPF